MIPYREWISQSSNERKTRIILALDLDGGNRAILYRSGKRLLESTIDSLCALKLGRQTIFNIGREATKQIINRAHEDDVPCIVDDKISDIGETNRAVADSYFRMGFDALTASPFVGWVDGLQPLFKAAHDKSKGVIVLSYMSHDGASEVAGQKVITERGKQTPQYLLFAKRALGWKADGLVVGATRPKVVQTVKQLVDNKIPIYSPGVGAQGGSLARSARSGTDFFILGRSIANSNDPGKITAQFAKESIC